MRAELAASFVEMTAGQLPRLRRFAYAVSGDRHRADDLVQSALERMYVAWPRVHDVADPGAYVRTILVRLATRDTRRMWRRELATAAPPEQAAPDHAAGSGG
jgi:DNA-directed RNA polymerase specialized sigma24 family protein